MIKEDLYTAVSEVMEISKKLNQQLETYYNKTVKLNELLEKDDEEIVFEIQEIINQRDLTKEQFDMLKKEYIKTTDVYKIKIAGDADAVSELNSLLNDLEVNRNEILLSIEKNDKIIAQKIFKLYDIYKEKIKKLSDDRKLNNAYHSIIPLVDGLYFDRYK